MSGGKSVNAKSRAATANMVDTALRKIMSDLQVEQEHKSLVSKKFSSSDKYYDELSGLKERAQKAAKESGTAPVLVVSLLNLSVFF